MNHPKREEWVPYLFGEATPQTRDKLTEHLQNCPDCAAEIAEILEIPEGTVNSRLAEGLAQLTRILEPQFDGRRGRLNPIQTNEADDVRKRSGSSPARPDISPPSARRGLQMKAADL